jgi:hypothetical protein
MAVEIADLEKRAERLLIQRVTQEAKIELARKKAGLPAMEKKLEKIKAELVQVMDEGGIDQVEGSGFHATLIRANYGSMFIATDDDLRALDEIPEDRKLIPMRTILKRKFKDKAVFREVWNRITKRVIVVEALEEVIAEGLLTVDEIAPAFIEKQKKPYVRVFED